MMKNMLAKMRSSPIKTIVLAIVIVFVTINYSGFCFSQFRFLSDEELIEIAVREQIRFKMIDVSKDSASIRAFVASNPGCCRVTRDSPGQNLLSKITLGRAVEVEVNHQVSAERVPMVGKYYESYTVILPCGKVGRSYGTDTDSLKKIEVSQ